MVVSITGSGGSAGASGDPLLARILVLVGAELEKLGGAEASAVADQVAMLYVQLCAAGLLGEHLFEVFTAVMGPERAEELRTTLRDQAAKLFEIVREQVDMDVVGMPPEPVEVER